MAYDIKQLLTTEAEPEPVINPVALDEQQQLTLIKHEKLHKLLQNRTSRSTED